MTDPGYLFFVGRSLDGVTLALHVDITGGVFSECPSCQSATGFTVHKSITAAQWAGCHGCGVLFYEKELPHEIIRFD